MDEVVIHLCSMINEQNVVNLELKLKDVIISGYSFHGSGNQDPVPTEEITLNYAGVEWTYKKFDTMGNEAGNFPANYDTQAAAIVKSSSWLGLEALGDTPRRTGTCSTSRDSSVVAELARLVPWLVGAVVRVRGLRHSAEIHLSTRYVRMPGRGPAVSAGVVGWDSRMPDYTQEMHRISVKTPLGKDKLYLSSFQGQEEFSRLFKYSLDLLSDDDWVDPKSIVGKSVTVSLQYPDDSERFFNGIVSRFSLFGNGGPSQRVPGRNGAVSVVSDPLVRLPHLPGEEDPGHHRRGVQRPRLFGLQAGTDQVLSRAGILRPVPGDGLQLRVPVDGAVRDLLLLQARRRQAHDGAWGRRRVRTRTAWRTRSLFGGTSRATST